MRMSVEQPTLPVCRGKCLYRMDTIGRRRPASGQRYTITERESEVANLEFNVSRGVRLRWKPNSNRLTCCSRSGFWFRFFFGTCFDIGKALVPAAQLSWLAQLVDWMKRSRISHKSRRQTVPDAPPTLDASRRTVVT